MLYYILLSTSISSRKHIDWATGPAGNDVFQGYRHSFGFLGLQGLAETTATSLSGFEVRGLEVSRLSEWHIARCKIGEALTLTASLEQHIYYIQTGSSTTKMVFIPCGIDTTA